MHLSLRALSDVVEADVRPLLPLPMVPGYDAVLFEGPGQGSVIRRQGIPFTPAWEKPVAALLDHFELTDVTLLGISLGGCLAPRAAAFEPRVRRVIAFDVCWDLFQAGLSTRPPPLRLALRALVALRAGRLLDRVSAARWSATPSRAGRWSTAATCSASSGPTTTSDA
jgi:pimeloyl-ACP methyl ester carboxylesterase